MRDATSKLMRGLLEPLLLESIAREPKHGYALIQELEAVFGEPPNRNQVYPLLNRLEQEGILRADREEGRGKTRYALTGKGLELVKEYRLRTPLFRARIEALWPSEAAPSTPAAPEPSDPGPHLLDHIVAEPLPAAAPRPSPAPAPQAGCQAEIVLRRKGGDDRVAFEAANLDPACATCQALRRDLQALRDRWF